MVISQRLQTTASAGEIVVSEALFRHCRGAFSARLREPVTVKGITAAVNSYLINSVMENSNEPAGVMCESEHAAIGLSVGEPDEPGSPEPVASE